MRRRSQLVPTALAVVAAFATAAPAGAATSSGQVRVQGPHYAKTFTVVGCVRSGGTRIDLTGRAAGQETAGLWLRLVGKDGSGTLTITGEANLRGRLTSVHVAATGRIAVEGRFTAGGVTGPFTVTGRC